MLACLLLLIPPDPAALGSPEHADRERAESHLRSLGPLAWPALLSALSSPDPEVRFRADRLLGPYRSWVWDGRVRAALLGPWPPSPADLWHDEELRSRVHREAVKLGCPPDEAAPLLPGFYDGRCGWWENFVPVVRCYRALEVCRKRSGALEWPFK